MKENGDYSQTFKQKEISSLINDIINQKNGSQEKFIENIPQILFNLTNEEITQQFIPFIISSINLNEIEICQKILIIIDSLLNSNINEEIFINFIDIIIEIIRKNSIFLENEILNIFEKIKLKLSTDIIQFYFYPSLTKLIYPIHTDALGLSLRLLSIFFEKLSLNSQNYLINNLIYYFSNSFSSTYIKICILKSIINIINFISNLKNFLDFTLILSFNDSDYRIRSQSIIIISTIPKYFFQIYNDFNLIKNFFNDNSWSVRFSIAQHIPLLIEYCDFKNELIDILFVLTEDSVLSIRSISINSLIKTINYFNLNHLENFPNIFENSIKSISEEIRDPIIFLWSELLKKFPDSIIHCKLSPFINLIGNVPVENLIIKILMNIIPYLSLNLIDIKNIQRGLNILLNSNDKPQNVISGILIGIEYTKFNHLKNLCLILFPNFSFFCKSYIYCIRKYSFELLKSYFILCGFDWSFNNIFPIILELNLESNIYKFNINDFLDFLNPLISDNEKKEILKFVN